MARFEGIRKQVRTLDEAYRAHRRAGQPRRERVQTTLFGAAETPSAPAGIWQAHHALVSRCLELCALSETLVDSLRPARELRPDEFTAEWSDVGSEGASGLWKAVELANRYDPLHTHVRQAERAALVHVAALEHYRCGRHGVARAMLRERAAPVPAEAVPVEPLAFLSRMAEAWVESPSQWTASALALRQIARDELALENPRVGKAALLGLCAAAESLQSLHAAAVEGSAEAWDSAGAGLADAVTLLGPYGSPGVDLILSAMRRSLSALRSMSVWEWSRAALPQEHPAAAAWTRLRAVDKPFFFPSQVEVLATDLASESTMVSMPTGAGKTVVAEAYLLKQFIAAPARKHFVIVPTKALASEKFQELEEAFGWAGGPRLCKLTSDVTANNERALAESDIVVLTPEKFDVLMRRRFYSGGQRDVVGGLVVDEFHMLRDDVRGIKLQLTLHRFLSLYPRPVLYISAILSDGDARALQRWTGAARLVRHRWRPVLLRVGTVDLAARGRPIELDFDDGTLRSLDAVEAHGSDHIPPEVAVLTELLRDGPVLRYSMRATNRKGPPLPVHDGLRLVKAGLKLRTGPELPRHVQNLRRLVGEASPIVDLLAQGIGTHWGSLPQRARLIVEGAARDGSAPLVLATSTLADGVNMPFRTVWFPRAKGRDRRLGESTYLNTAGRAGRPYKHVEGQVVLAYHTGGAQAIPRDYVRRYVDLDADSLPPLLGAIALLARYYGGRVGAVAEDEVVKDDERYSQFQVLCAMVLAAVVERMTTRIAGSEELRRCFVVQEERSPAVDIDGLLSAVEAELLAQGCIQPGPEGRVAPTPWGTVVYGTGLAPESCRRLRERLVELVAEFGGKSWHPRHATSAVAGKPITALIEVSALPVEFPRDEKRDTYLIRGWMAGLHLAAVAADTNQEPGIRYLWALSRAEEHVSHWFSWLFDAMALIGEHERARVPETRRRDLRALARASTHGDFRPWVQSVMRNDVRRALLRDDVVSVREAAARAGGFKLIEPSPEGLLRFIAERHVETRAPPDEVARGLGDALRRAQAEAGRQAPASR